MNAVLLTGRSGSKSIPGKNVYPILGRPLVSYPMTAAKQAKHVDAVYVTTDCPDIKAVARQFGVQIIDRPAELAGDNSEMVDGIVHALDAMGHKVKILVTMHCNCAVHRPGLLDECIEQLQAHPEADSCVSGYTDRSVHPFRTKRVDEDGYLNDWMEIPAQSSNNRQNLPGCFILDGGARAMRVQRCFPPRSKSLFAYLGNRIRYVENQPVSDIHGIDDIVLAEYYLRKLGWKDAET